MKFRIGDKILLPEYLGERESGEVINHDDSFRFNVLVRTKNSCLWWNEHRLDFSPKWSGSSEETKGQEFELSEVTEGSIILSSPRLRPDPDAIGPRFSLLELD
jgi:hypothetical protein